MDDSTILENVIEVLKASGKAMVAREIVRALSLRGVNVEKHQLNQILWSEDRNIRRSEMEVDGNFRWKWIPKASDSPSIKPARSVAEQQVIEVWKVLDFEFFGIKRKGADKWFFFLGENADGYKVVGPTGQVMIESKSICSPPEERDFSCFTSDQIAVAVQETIKNRIREFEASQSEIIRHVRDGERLRERAYIGPQVCRIETHIPLDAAIQIVPLNTFNTLTLEFGTGAVFKPLVLVIDILGMGLEDDRRYGVFQICVYRLIKDGFVREKNGGLLLDLIYLDGRVQIVAAEKMLPVE